MNEPMIQDTPLKDGPRPAERRKAAPMPRWVLVTLVLLVLGVLVFAILHTTGHGMGGMHMAIPDARRFLL
jgi:DNA-binding helix-hairpin-helix protein with protein kinase domain